MNNPHIIFGTLMAMSAALSLPALAVAQTQGSGEAPARPIDVIDISHGASSGNIKARLNLPEGRSISGVVGKKWYLVDGSCTERNTYKTIGPYLIADIDYTAGDDYFYSLEVTLDDGSVLSTDMYNAAYTEGAKWLSDFKTWTTNANEANRPLVGFDVCPNGPVGDDGNIATSPIEIRPNVPLYKGISMRPKANGTYILFNVQNDNEHNVPFTYAKLTFGLQAYAYGGAPSSGDSRMIVKRNNGDGNRANMKAYSNPNRGNGAFAFDVTETVVNGIFNFGVQSNTAGGDNFANLGACRLYYSLPPTSKEAQTVVFESQGGKILEANPTATISAYATGGTTVYYQIAEGADIATLEQDESGAWVLKPKLDKTGTVTVEALTFGDATYAPASATQTFTFRFGPVVDYLYTHKAAENPTDQTMYIYVDPKNETLENLRLEIYDNVRSFTLLNDMDLTSSLESYRTHIPNVYAIPFTNAANGGATPVHRITYKFSNEDEVVTDLYEGQEPFVYVSDLPGINVRTGWGQVSEDKGYGTSGRLRNSQYEYNKGYGLHASGWMETPGTLDLSQFSRFCVDLGGQVISNNSRGRLSFALYNGVSQPYLTTGNVAWQNVYEWDFPLQSTAAGKTLKITCGDGGDGNTNDVVCIGAPRFYYHYTPRESQFMQWDTEDVALNNYKAFSVELDAKASTGKPVIYRIVRGSEIAKIQENNQLYFYDNIPAEGEVVVEAFQPGDKEYAPSDVATRLFRVKRSMIIQANERVELTGGREIDELIIYANSQSAGQAVVNDGIVNVKKLVLKYTFVPGEWNYISFPSDLDLNAISNLADKGFSYYDAEGKSGTFLLREFDSSKRSEGAEADPWIWPSLPRVKGLKGYLMKLERDDKTPEEITFNIDNVSLDFESTVRSMNVLIDMSQCEPQTRHTVYIRPANVKGNTLRVEMRYVPTDNSQLPINHARALEQMRVTYSPDRSAIRLTLPDQSPAKVAIFDRKGKKLLKSVSYISPMQIDISDLKHGKYRMVVMYGPASIDREVEL